MNCEKIINIVQAGFSDWVAIVVSVAALLFSIKQFCYERNRNRKEATIHAFDQLESNESIKYLFSCSQSDIDTLVKDTNRLITVLRISGI